MRLDSMTHGDPAPSRTLKLTIAYDGSAYAGWQFQVDRPTVQTALEAAIVKVTGQTVRVLASGRTDAGVHALGQVVGVRTDSKLPAEVLLRALNANLPRDIAVLDVAEAPEGFHPIGSVVRKRYRYVIHDGPVRDVFQRHYTWHYNRGRLDADAMRRAAAPLLGRHDFSSFESSGAERKSSVRTVFELTVERGRAANLPSPFGRGAGGEGGVERGRAGGEGRTADLPSRASTEGWPGRDAGGEGSIERGRAGQRESRPHAEREEYADFLPHAEREEYIVIEIEADGFLYNMVRAIVGTLVQVGSGYRPESWPGEVLLAADRRAAGPTAPPQGLFLVRVEYEEKKQEH